MFQFPYEHKQGRNMLLRVLNPFKICFHCCLEGDCSTLNENKRDSNKRKSKKSLFLSTPRSGSSGISRLPVQSCCRAASSTEPWWRRVRGVGVWWANSMPQSLGKLSKVKVKQVPVWVNILGSLIQMATVKRMILCIIFQTSSTRRLMGWEGHPQGLGVMVQLGETYLSTWC